MLIYCAKYRICSYIITFVYFTLDIAALKHEIDFLYIPLCIKTINVLYFDRRHAKESKKLTNLQQLQIICQMIVK